MIGESEMRGLAALDVVWREDARVRSLPEQWEGRPGV